MSLKEVNTDLSLFKVLLFLDYIWIIIWLWNAASLKYSVAHGPQLTGF